MWNSSLFTGPTTRSDPSDLTDLIDRLDLTGHTHRSGRLSRTGLLGRTGRLGPTGHSGRMGQTGRTGQIGPTGPIGLMDRSTLFIPTGRSDRMDQEDHGWMDSIILLEGTSKFFESIELSCFFFHEVRLQNLIMIIYLSFIDSVFNEKTHSYKRLLLINWFLLLQFFKVEKNN